MNWEDLVSAGVTDSDKIDLLREAVKSLRTLQEELQEQIWSLEARVTQLDDPCAPRPEKIKPTKTMRTLTDHKINGLNEAIAVSVLDEPGQGNACHHYRMQWTRPEHRHDGSECAGVYALEIKFQNGPIQEAGVNGISQEALLTVVIDRLRSFQAGQYSCRENAIALTHCEDALMWLQKRTRDRMARGVEGTNAK